MTTIWIEPVPRPDGQPWYVPRKERLTAAGLQLRTRLGGPEGEVLVERTTNPVVTSCRALLARGITGHFETRKPGIPYRCMRGDIESTADLTIEEPDKKNRDCRPRFVPARQWGVPPDQNAPPLPRTTAPASEREVAGRVVAADTSARSSAGGARTWVDAGGR